MHRCYTNARGCVSIPSTHLVGPCCIYIQVPQNPASRRRQAQAYPTHPHVACIASCQQKGSPWDCQMELLRECRQQYPQWLPSESPPRLTCWMSDKPCTKNRKMSSLLHFTLLVLKQSNLLFAEKLPTVNRQLAAHAWFLSGKLLCLGPECHTGTEGIAVQHLGLTPAPAAESMAEETGPRWISRHREALCTGLDGGQRVHVCNDAALCRLQHREQIPFQMLLPLLTFQWIL